MAIQNLNTYSGWIADGRQVRSGEKAPSWHQAETGELSPLFHLNQTSDLDLPDLSLGRFITRLEREALKEASPSRPRVKLIIDPQEDDGKYRLRVWCGNNRALITALKDAGWKYAGNLHRWVKYAPFPDDVIAGFERKLGCLVELDDRR